MDNIVLYSYFRSSASYRVRAALNLKKLPFTTKAVNLKSAEHLLPDFNQISSFSEVPILEHNGNQIAQSMAIILYLEDTFKEVLPLFPELSYDKAIVTQMCEVVNSGIHPVQNLKVGKKLKADHGFSNEEVFAWSRYWISSGFASLEKLLQNFAGDFCFGNKISAADLFLVPQVYNAKRYEVDMSKYPNITRVDQNSLAMPEVKLASPGFQPDTPDELKETL